MAYAMGVQTSSSMCGEMSQKDDIRETNIGRMLRELGERKDVEIIEAKCCPSYTAGVDTAEDEWVRRALEGEKLSNDLR